MRSTEELRKSCWRTVRQAFYDGVLTRPDQCSECGRSEPIRNAARPLVVAHHCDYRKPLALIWFCDSCHRRWHGVHVAYPLTARDAERLRRGHRIPGWGATPTAAEAIAQARGEAA